MEDSVQEVDDNDNQTDDESELDYGFDIYDDSNQRLNDEFDHFDFDGTIPLNL
jgi:uncharacterized membrane protein YvbJ